MAEQVKGGATAMSTLSLSEVKAVVKELLKRYHAEYALLFGSYARGDFLTILLAFFGSFLLIRQLEIFLSEHKSSSEVFLFYDLVFCQFLR